MDCSPPGSSVHGILQARILEQVAISYSGSWEIDGETVETVSDFILGGSKITADGDCSHEIKRRLLLGRKVMTPASPALAGRFLTTGPPGKPRKANLKGVVGAEEWDREMLA